MRILGIFILFYTILETLHAQDASPGQNTQETKPPPPDLKPGNNQNQQQESVYKQILDINDWTSFKNVIPKGEMKGFFTLKQAEEIIAYFSQEFPELFYPVEFVGQSFENRDIKMHCMSKRESNLDLDQEAAIKTMALITALHHPREPMSLSMLVFSIFRMLAEYRKGNQEYVSLLNNNIICIIPAVNIDGYNHIEEGFKTSGRFPRIRKNRNNQFTCTHDIDVGVDLNRNYDYCWDKDELGSSTDKCDESFRGTAPFSEPETRAIRDLIERFKDSIKLAVNIHAYGNLWIYPFNCYENDTPYKTKRVMSIYEDFTSKAPLPPGALIGNAITTVKYTANGEASDWLLGKYGIIAYSPEIGLHLPNSEADVFFPKEEVIYEVVTADFPGVFYMLSKLNPGIEFQEVNEKRLGSRNNRKAVYLDLINKAYVDLSEGEMIVNMTVFGIQDVSVAPLLPEISLIETHIDNSTSYNSIFFESDKVLVKTLDANRTIYTATQNFGLKSWGNIQVVVIFPFANFASVHMEVKAMHKGVELYSFEQDFTGVETITTSKKVYILGIALALSAVVFLAIVCGTHYYLKEKKSQKSPGNMFSKNQAPGLEFAQIENEESEEV